MTEESFADRMVSQEMRYAYQLSFSVQMVTDIAMQYNATVDRGETLSALSMIDSFYVNIRLLVEFLAKPTKLDIDFGPPDLGVSDWRVDAVRALSEGQRALDYWKQASAYVVHFGRDRVPERLEDLRQFDIGGDLFRLMARDVLSLMGRFIAELECTSAGKALRVPSPIDFLRADFIRCCSEIGLGHAEVLLPLREREGVILEGGGHDVAD